MKSNCNFGIMKKTPYHTWLFLFGLIYYLILPAFVIASRIWMDYPGMDNLYFYYKDEYLLGYFFLVLVITIPFFIGANLPYCSCRKHSSLVRQIIISSRSLFIITLPVFLYSQYVIWTNRSYMFQGYLADIETPFKGTIATINMIFLFVFLYNKNGEYSSKTNIFLTLILLELSIVSLGLGTRMYALVTLFSIIVYLLDKQTVALKRMMLWFSVIVFFLLAVGIWRLGDTNISLDQLLYIGIAEPTLTWISAISMYDLNELPLIAFPSNFISSFVNFIPSSVLPDKSELISEISLKYDAPLGATSVLLSLISNFGILGSMLALFCLGFFLSQIRLHWQTPFGLSYYYCVCGIIPFQLFRDDMGIVNKQIFSNLLFVPMIIFFIHRFFVGYKILSMSLE